MGVTSWKSYDYESHPFKDVDMSKRMGLVIPESAGLFTEAISPLYSIFKSVIGLEQPSALSSNQINHPIYRNEAEA